MVAALATPEWVRTFVALTTPSNDLVGRIHDWMPAILDPGDYERWFGTSLTRGTSSSRSRASPMTI